MASLSRVASSAAFLDALEKSGLLAAAEMASVRSAAADDGDPKLLARDLVKAGTLTRWQAAQLLHGYYLLVVGKFKLLDQLGSGETGRVYLAEHVQIQRRHALKILSRRHASKPEVLKRFLGEAQRVCALDHRNLSHVYDVNQDGDKYYLVMEHVEGQDLQKLVENSGPLATVAAAEYARQAADGLAHAHEQGVVHGDLKPTNLLVDGGGLVKITDIGQARLMEAPIAASGAASDDETTETTETASLAAAIYRAPELLAGGQAADPRCDVYSLGSVLCYLLSGRACASADDARKLLAAKNVPAELVEVVGSMMEADPVQRLGSMEDVLAELAAAAAQMTKEPAKEAAVPPPKRTKKPLVAKAIDDPALTTPAADAATPADPFAGFAVQATKGGKGKRAAATAGKPAIVAAATDEGGAGSATPAKKSKLPLLIGAAVGGGVLVLGGIVVAVVLAMNWASDSAENLVADAKAAVEKTAAKSTAATADKAGPEANPESNPTLSLESNPAPGPAATPSAAPAVNPLTPPSAGTPPPMPMPMPVAPMPAPTPTPAPEPAPPPEPVQPEPAKPEPAAPEPAQPPAEPFAGFAKAVTLPKLAPSPGEPAGEALAPLVLGPCVVADKQLVIISLKGGDGAIRGGKQKFEIAAAQDGTALRDWEISLTGGANPPLVVALLSVKDDQLTFQWTPAGAKEDSAPLLGNCGLHLSAGAGQHDVALRTPVVAEPLAVNLERIGSSVKWNIDLLPDAKKIFVEITRLEGDFLEHKFKERQTLEGSDSTEVWTGSAQDAMVLGLKITSTVSAQSVQVKSSPQYQLKAMQRPKLLVKKELGLIEKQLDQGRFVANRKIEVAKKAKAEAQQNLSEQELDKVNEAAEQLTELKSLIDGLDGKGAVHFRVFYQTEDGPIDLLVTEEGGPAEEPAAEEAPTDKPDPAKDAKDKKK